MKNWSKRMFDIVVSAIALVLLSPILSLLAVLVWRKLGQPILFRQERPGLDAKPFTMVKFRTMTKEQGENGELLPDAARLKPFGQWLRSTSLDELPELWNVLKGEMSLVGPRPLLIRYVPRYSKSQFRRHGVRPGITGWAQIMGRNDLSWQRKFELDTWYVDNHSMVIDLKILLLTVAKVVRRQGIAASGEATMTEFMGDEQSEPSATGSA